MATKRAAVVDAFATKIAALRTSPGNAEFLGSVNKYARALTEVNDQPSVDIFSRGRVREQLPARQSRQTLTVTVRIWHRQGKHTELDDLIELVEAAIRSDSTLGGLVIDTWSEGDETDEGWLGFAGHGAMAEVRFTARWEATET